MRKLMTLLALGALIVPLLVLPVSSVYPAIPHVINYQGMLTDDAGYLLTGFYDLTFGIYDDSTAGNLKWSETQNEVRVQNGLFNVGLGTETALNLAFDEPYWLQLVVATDTMPRLRITSVGYAYRASVADSAIVAISGTDTLANKILVSPTITTSPTAVGATWADLGTVTTADINGGTIDGATIGAATPAAGTFAALQTGSDGADGQLTVYSEQGGTDYSVVLQPHATMTQTTTYTMPTNDGDANQILATDGAGALSWADAAAGSGDITAVGDVATGAAFDGTGGNALQFEGATADGFEITLQGADPGADFTLTLPAATDVLIGKATTDILTNKTLTSPVLNTGVSGTAVLDEDNMATNSATQLATQQSIKTYVDAQAGGDITAVGDVASGGAFDGTGGNALQFEGATADGFEITLEGADPGADFTLTLPAATDVLIGKATTDVLTNKSLTSPTIGTSPTAVGATWADLGTVTTADIDGGTLDGVTITSPVLNTGVSGTAVLDEDNMATNSATQLATQQSIKAYVDAQVVGGDFADNTFTVYDEGDNTKILAFQTSGITTGNTRTLTVPDYNGTVATLAGTETMTNKTLTSPTIGTSPTAAGATWDDLGTVTTADINGGTIDGAVIGGATPAAGSFTTADIDGGTLDGVTITSPVLNTGVSGTAVLDEDNMATNSATQLATQQSIKAYVDAQVVGGDFADNTFTVFDDLDNTKILALDVSGITTLNTRTLTVPDYNGTVATLAGTETMTNKTLTSPTIGTSPTAVGATWANLGTVTTVDINGGTIDGATITSPVLNTGVSGTAVLDEDNMATNSATQLATQQSIKAYVDAQVGGGDFADNTFTVFDDLDNTKILALDVSGITTLNTRTLTVPDYNGTVATLAGTETMTNKTLTSPTIATSPTAAGATWDDLGTVTTADINGGAIDGTTIGGATPAAGSFTTADIDGGTLDGVTITSPVLNTGVSGTAVLDEDNMATNSATQLATQQSIKAYVDAQVGGGDFADNTFTVFDDLDNTKILALDVSGITTLNTRTLTVPDYNGTVATLAGTETMTNKTLTSPTIGTSPTAVGATWANLGTVTTVDINGGTIDGATITSPVLNTGVSGTAVLDEDNMATNSATQLATQQSIKAYVDAQVGGGDFADNTFTVFDDLDNTKILALDVSGITTLNTRTLTVPDYNGTVATLAGTETMTNKTLTSPTIGTSPTAVGATWANLGTVTTVDINGGTIDGATIGGATPAAGSFTTGTIATADINGGAIDGTTIGATTPAAGSFAALQTGSDGVDGQLIVYSEQGATDYSMVLQPHATMTQTTTYTMPADDGDASQVLTSDGAGALNWTTPTVGDITAVGSMTSGAAFADATTTGNWLGLGAAAGRIEFDDQAQMK